MKKGRNLNALLWAVLCTVLLMAAQVQPCRADVVKGKVVNAETGEPLAKVSVSSVIAPYPGWSFQNSAESDSTGVFFLTSAWEGRIVFTFKMIGFKVMRKVDYVYGPESKDTLDIGTVRLQPTALMLKEVEVKARLPRITMKGDTIVFNPEAFKLKDGARLDELIRKLPGVQQRDGKLYWNDKPIRLMMNGKNIFGGDAIVGRLPAEVADKIKLYDRKSAMARRSGKDDGKEDNVLDIQVKPGFLDKWYGEAEAGYMTKKRYDFNTTLNRLSDHDPQMVYAQANNENHGVDRTMRSSSNTNIDQDGKSQYGSYSYQHNWSTKGADPSDNNMVNVNASLDNRNGWGTKLTNKETFLPGDEHTFATARDYHNNKALSPKMNFGVYVYTDSVNLVDVNLSASYFKETNLTEQQSAKYGYSAGGFSDSPLDAAMSAKPGDALYSRLITRNTNYVSEDRRTANLSASYSWQHFLDRRSSFTVQGQTAYTDSRSWQHTTRNLEWLRENTAEKLWQYGKTPQHDFDSWGAFVLEKWFTDNVYVYGSEAVGYSRQHAKTNFFADTDEQLVDNGTPTTPDTANSLDRVQRTLWNKAVLSMVVTPAKGLSVVPQMSWIYQHENVDYHRGTLDTVAVRNYHKFQPQLRVKWKVNRTNSMDANFVYNTTVPDIVSTIAYRDDSDPLWIAYGNARLHNSHTQTTALNYRRMWLRKQINLSVGVSYTKNINPITMLYHYNSGTGVYTAMPVNSKSGDEWSFALNYDQGLGVDFHIMNLAAAQFSNSYGYMTVTGDNAAPQLNHQRVFTVNNRFEFSYETDILHLKLFNNLNWARYRYTDASYNSHPLYMNYGIDAWWKLKAFRFSLNLSDSYRSGYRMSSGNGHQLVTGAGVTYTFYKNKCRLTLSADDIFNKEKYIGNNYSAYSREETREEYLHHTLSLTFHYSFDAKAKKK